MDNVYIIEIKKKLINKKSSSPSRVQSAAVQQPINPFSEYFHTRRGPLSH